MVVGKLDHVVFALALLKSSCAAAFSVVESVPRKPLVAQTTFSMWVVALEQSTEVPGWCVPVPSPVPSSLPHARPSRARPTGTARRESLKWVFIVRSFR